MHFRFHLLLAFIILTAASFKTDCPVGEDHQYPKRIIGWAVQKTSTIQIKGATNINKFGCDIFNYTQPDTIFCTPEIVNGEPVTLSGGLQVGISQFSCHNKMLTNDLRKTLKADEYPVLVIRFLSLERAPTINISKDCLTGWVEIELAGCTKRFEVNYSFVASGQSSIQLNGNRSFSFSYFKLKAPKKFAGLIKVKDTLIVDFNLLPDPIE